MTIRPAARLRRLAAAPPDPDRHLLAAFLADRSAEAFAELVRRHGPLVHGVCRRVLGHAQDAEDAFQATFLVLARKAASVRRTDSLTPWLYAVAVRTARELRHMRDRRRKHEQASGGVHPRRPDGGGEPRRSPEQDDLAALLDEELAKLPDHYRLPVVLCELEGRPRRAVAAELGIPEGTLSSRLAAAKKKLAERLARRGVTASAGAVAAALGREAAARVPVPLLAHTARAVFDPAAGLASAAAVRLADGVVKALFVAKLKGLAVVVGLAAAGFGGFALAPAGAGDGPPAAAPAAPDPAALVRRLGSPTFADREAAEKALKALGPAAKPAVRAGMADPDPEVAKRAADVRDAIRRDQLWAAFARIAGDDRPARDLFAKIMASPRGVDALEAALDDPATADDLFRARTAELLRVAAGYPPTVGPGEPEGDTRPYIHAPPPVPVGDVAGWLFLGALQPGTRPWIRVTHPGWVNKLTSHVPFLPEDDYTSAEPVQEAFRAADSAPLKKLTAAWLRKRRENDLLRAGLALAVRFDIPESLAAIRAVLKDPKPADVEPWNLAAAAAFVALRGSKDDLPLLARHAADDRPHVTILNLPKDFNAKHSFAVPAEEGRDLFCHVRDIVVVAMCELAGKYPPQFGFPPLPDAKHPNGAAKPLSSLTAVGFKTKAARDAAHAKAAAWVKTFEKPTAPPIDPEAEKLVRQLGSPKFEDREAAEKALKAMGLRAKGAVQAGLTSPDPEVARRCAAVRDHIRREEHWPRFARLIGEDQAARDLYAQVIARRRTAELLDAVTADPAKAADVYFDRLTELNAQVPNPRTIRADYVELPDLLGWLYLGTFPDSGGTRMRSMTIQFQRTYIDWTDTALNRLLAKPNDPAAAAARKLVGRWLAERRDDDGQWLGLVLALELDLPEAAAAAKAFLKLPGPNPQYAGNRGRSLLVVAKYGTAADVPLLLSFADDTTACLTLPPDDAPPEPAENRKRSGPRRLPPGGPTTQLRDIAVAAAVRLRGGDPRALGWYARAGGKGDPVLSPEGRDMGTRQFRTPVDLPMFGAHAFTTDKDRQAAHAKAKAWLEQNPAPGEKKEAPKIDPEAEKLVKQLGAPAFAEREAAEKKLRALGPKAAPALRAGLQSPDPEVAKRAGAVLAAVRADARDALARQFDPKATADYDHPVWKRFVGIAGDSRAGRELFAKIVANAKWLRALDDAEADPAAAGHIYRVGIAEVFRDFHNDPARSPPWPCDRPEEVAYLLLLGSHPDPNPPAKLVGDEVVPTSPRSLAVLGRGIIHGEGQITHANGLDLGLRGTYRFGGPAGAAGAGTDRVFARLFAAWLARRPPSAEVVPRGFQIAREQRVPELLPLARRYAANDFEPRRDIPPFATIKALELVAQLGTRADLPLLERYFGDETNVAAADKPRTDAARDYYRPPPVTDATQLRDVALGLALLLHGGNPADFGFVVREGVLKQAAGRYDVPRLSQLHLGFKTEADRAAGFEKAKAWLAERKKADPPAAPKPDKDPEAEKLVRQLGAPAFADREAAEKKLLARGAAALPAVRAGLADPDPEVAARCKALLPHLRADALAAFAAAVRADPAAPGGFDHPIWARFAAVVGTDPAARRLLADLLADGRRAKVLDDAEADPAAVPGLYAAELDRISAHLEKTEKQNGLAIIVLPPAEYEKFLPPAAEVNLFLFLGTYPNSGTPPGEAREGTFLYGRPGVVRGLGGTPTAPEARLFVRWLDRRTAKDPLTFGLIRCSTHGVTAALPVARKVWASAAAPEARAWALSFLGRYGGEADRPVVEAALADDTSAMRFRQGRTDIPYEVRFRDVAVAVSLLRRGVDLKAFGFPLLQGDSRWGTEGSPYGPWHHGFPNEAGREALHAKAKAWLTANPGRWDDPVDPAAEKLVRQLGAPAFADREAAEKKLLEMPAAAAGAVRAGRTNPDPEIAARCKALLPRVLSAALAVSDHPAWLRFKKLVGDDAATRKLFLDMIADGRRAEQLDVAVRDPARAGEVYAAELTRAVDAIKKGYAEAEVRNAGRSGINLPDSGYPTRGEFGTLLFLGTYPAAAKVGYKRENDHDRVAYHNLFGFGLRSPRARDNPPPTPPEVRRLFAAWLAARDEPDVQDHAFSLVTHSDIREALPAARAAAGNEKLAGPARGRALLAVGQLGAKEDLPLVAKAFADDRVVWTSRYTDGKGGERPIALQVRDCALAAALHLSGQDPADYGFPYLEIYKVRKDPDVLKKYHLLGFSDAAGRDAAHARAKAWFESQEKKK